MMVGRYRLAEPLGVGSFATVFRGVDEQSGESVAIKSITIARLTDEVSPACVARRRVRNPSERTPPN